MADSKHDILFVVDVARFDSVESLEDLVSSGDGVNQLVRGRAMATLSVDFDGHYGHSSEEASGTAPDVSFFKVGDVVEAVDFIHSLKATFLNHGQGTTGALFSRLPQESHCFI